MAAKEEPQTKRQKTSSSDTKYTLLYHAGIPGRGEYIRLAFEATNTPYEDSSGSSEVYTLCSSDHVDDTLGPPKFAPPMLKIFDPSGEEYVISQTSNILLFLGRKLGLGGASEMEELWVNEIVLTALDLGNEVHDTHHPVAVGRFYEDQRGEALLKSADFRDNRLPKFLGYFERVLNANKEGAGRYLVGGRLSNADLVLWHVMDGLSFAFPKEMEVRKREFGDLWKFFEGHREGVLKEYLESGRRMKFSEGVFRYYKELDRQ